MEITFYKNRKDNFYISSEEWNNNWIYECSFLIWKTPVYFKYKVARNLFLQKKLSYGSASILICVSPYIVTGWYNQSHWSFCFMTDLNHPSIQPATHRFLRRTSCIERLDELWLEQKVRMTRKTDMRRKHATIGI